MSAHPHAVTIAADRVVKMTDLQTVRLEAAVTGAAHRLSMTAGDFFYTPAVLACDMEAGKITLERLDGLVAIGEYLHRLADDLRLAAMVGRTLACLHDGIALPEWARIAAPAPWLMPCETPVVIHGDFNATNVCYEPLCDRVVVIDFAPGPTLPRCSLGPRELDAASFIRALLLQQPHLWPAIRRFRVRRESFMQAYEGHAQKPLNRARVRQLLLRLTWAGLCKQVRQGKLVSALHSVLAMPIFIAMPVRGTRIPCPTRNRRCSDE